MSPKSRKNQLYFFASLIYFFTLLACQPSPPPPPPPSLSDSAALGPKPDFLEEDFQVLDLEEVVYLEISSLVAGLYQRPQLETKPQLELKRGDSLRFTGRLTKYSQKIEIQGLSYDEPWVSVAWQGQDYWVYGGNLCFNPNKTELEQKLAALTLERRLYRFFSPNLSKKILRHSSDWAKVQTLPAFALLEEQSWELRDSLNRALNHYLKADALSQGEEPDFFWLNAFLQGYVLHLGRKTRTYALFRDFRAWRDLALKTPEPQDDSLCALWLRLYATDSIEYFYPDWLLPCGPKDSLFCTTLGQGLHLSLIRQLGNLELEGQGFFRRVLQALRREILADLLNNPYFWRSKAEALAELKAITELKGPPLQQADRVALKERLRALMKLGDSAFHYLEKGF